MSNKTFPMTEAGLKKIQQELNELESVKRVHAKMRIKKARSFCDFNEDSEYKLALEELARIEERILKLTHEIRHSEIIKKTSTTTVELGSTVTLKEVSDNDLETYTIVGSEEADPLTGKISNQSRVAESVLGAKVNDKVTISTPGGKRYVEIMRIS